MSPSRWLRLDARDWALRNGRSPEEAEAFADRYMATYGQLSTAGMRPTFAEAAERFAASPQ